MRFKTLVTAPESRPTLTVEQAVQAVEKRADALGRWLRRGAKLTLLALFVTSVVLTLLGLGSSLDWPFPGAGILLIVVCALPALLQMFDMLWPGVGVGQYRQLFSRVERRIVQRYRRGRLRTVFEAYGCESTAIRCVPEEASQFTVARRLAARRRWSKTLTVVIVLVVLGGLGAWRWLGHPERIHDVGESFTLGDEWDLTVESRPNCGTLPEPIGGSGCTIWVSLRNTSQSSTQIGPRNFSFLDPDGYWAYPGGGYYYVALLAGSYFYRPVYSALDDSPEIYPGNATRITLTFDVPTGALLTEIRFSTARSALEDIDTVRF